MNLRFVEAFYWVATLQSVSRAAEKLFITQSAMSARIAALEDELGTVLLDRRDKQFRLTFAGQRFLKHAARLLELQRDIKLEMGGDAPVEVQMRIGAIESVLHSWLIPWVEHLRAEYPALELELSVETTPVLIELVRRFGFWEYFNPWKNLPPGETNGYGANQFSWTAALMLDWLEK